MRSIDADALKEEFYNRKRTPDDMKYMRVPAEVVYQFIDNAPTVEPTESEYGAIQYSNGFNDGFTTAKDTIIHNIAKQYSEHNELVPEWLSIGDIRKGGAE